MRSTPPQLQYSICKDDVLIGVSAEYAQFARASDGDALGLAGYLGRNLLDVIEGDSTRDFWRNVFAEVRRRRQAKRVRYRCDAPDTRRFMMVEIEPGRGGELSLAHRLLRTEPLPVALRFSSSPAAVSVRCSLCNHVRHNDVWRSSDAAWMAGLLRNCSPNSVTYVVCPHCVDGAAQD